MSNRSHHDGKDSVLDVVLSQPQLTPERPIAWFQCGASERPVRRLNIQPVDTIETKMRFASSPHISCLYHPVVDLDFDCRAMRSQR